MIKILIVEDEFIIADSIAQILQTLGYEILDIAASYGEALEILDSEVPDLVLLDINLSGKKDGIDLAWKIREDYNIPFIFLTSNADAQTVARAKETDPPAYLVKPFNKDDLYTSIEICLYNYSKKADKSQQEMTDSCIIKDALFIKDGLYFHKIKFKDILYLESDHVYVSVVTENKKILVRSSMQQYLEHFPTDLFFRIHRSYVVNIEQIDSISISELIIKNHKIPIGKTYHKELLSKLKLG